LRKVRFWRKADLRETPTSVKCQINDPLRVVAFNTLEHRAKDVSEDIAAEIQTRPDVEGNELPELIRDFVESNRHNTRQLSLRLA